MPVNKKYYWLKLKSNFFNQREMKKLRAIAGGDTFTIIYLKMQLISLVENGSILYAETEENISEQIAIEIDENVEDVKLTIAFLKTNKLIEVDKNQDLILVETKELIGSETDSAKRVRMHRERTKTLQCNTDVTNCNTEIEKDIELDTELEKELELEKDIKKDIKVIENYFDNQELNILFNDFLKFRKTLKAKNTDRAIKLLINELNQHDDKTKIEMINNSIMSSWKSIYPPKKNKSSHETKIEWLQEL